MKIITILSLFYTCFFSTQGSLASQIEDPEGRQNPYNKIHTDNHSNSIKKSNINPICRLRDCIGAASAHFSPAYYQQIFSKVNRPLGAVSKAVGTAALAATFDYVISDRIEKRSTLHNLLKDFNNAEAEDKKIIDNFNLEMINDSALYTEKKYLSSSLADSTIKLNQRIISATQLEEAIGKLTASFSWRQFFEKDIQKSSHQLLLSTRKQKSYLQILYQINEALYQLQRKNYTSPELSPSAYSSLMKANSNLSIYFDNYYKALLEKEPEVLSAHKEELEEFRYFLTKVLNLQGIIQKRLARNAKSLAEIKKYTFLSFESYNNIIKDSPKDARNANVYCNKGYLAHSWMFDFEEGRKLFAQAHSLDPSNPLITMQRAVSEYWAYTFLRKDTPSRKEEYTLPLTQAGLEAPSLERAEFLITNAARQAPPNYLVRRAYAYLLLKFGLERKDPYFYKLSIKEFAEIESLLKEKKLNICGDFDYYYYYLLAQACAANGAYTRHETLSSIGKDNPFYARGVDAENHALGNLKKAQISFRDNINITALHNTDYYKKVDQVIQDYIEEIEAKGKLADITTFLKEDINYPLLKEDIDKDSSLLRQALREPRKDTKDHGHQEIKARIETLLSALQKAEEDNLKTKHGK